MGFFLYRDVRYFSLTISLILISLISRRVSHMEEWQHFLLVSVWPEGFRVSTKSFLFRFEKKTGQKPEEIVLGLDQVFKGIRWSKERGPIFGYDELVLSSDMRQANTRELVMYIDASPPTSESYLLRENNVSLHAIEVLTTGGEWKIIRACFLQGNINCHFLDIDFSIVRGWSPPNWR